jgi:hypothetical protein
MPICSKNLSREELDVPKARLVSAGPEVPEKVAVGGNRPEGAWRIGERERQIAFRQSKMSRGFSM